MNRITLLKGLRLALGGAVLGVAVFGLISSVLGVQDRTAMDALGAVLGGAGSMALVKLVHII